MEKDNRIEYRFIGHNDVCYGRGSNRAEACDDARATLGEPMSTKKEFDENGYLVAVEQEWTGVEWADVEVVAV